MDMEFNMLINNITDDSMKNKVEILKLMNRFDINDIYEMYYYDVNKSITEFKKMNIEKSLLFKKYLIKKYPLFNKIYRIKKLNKILKIK